MNNEYRIFIEGLNKWIRFVNRAYEVKQLLNIVRKGTAFPIAIYGPEGCGKTTLLRYLVKKVLNTINSLVIYVDALEEFSIERALLTSHKEIFELVEGLISLPIGATLAKAVMNIISKLSRRIALSGRNVLIIVDDVYRAIGLDNVSRYTKSLYEWINYLHENFNAGNVAIILTTSEGLSKRELSRHTYVQIYMMWNLPKDGFTELVNELNPPVDIDLDTLWRYTGGNPRALIELSQLNWDVGLWIRKIFEDKIRPIARLIPKTSLLDVAKDPDSNWEIARKLEEYGLMIEVRRVLTIGEPPKRDVELGIGEEWAWQIPAYKWAIEHFIH